MLVEDAVRKALAGRGVLKVKLLSLEERMEVWRLEEAYSRRPTPWGYPLNLGVQECLKRRHVMAALTSPSFKWPAGPYALIRVGRMVIGWIDERGVHVDARRMPSARARHEVIYLPLRLDELSEVLEGHVAASPSPPAHGYLAGLLGGGEGCGTLLLGFNSLRKCPDNYVGDLGD